jgi:hypothetical protein
LLRKSPSSLQRASSSHSSEVADLHRAGVADVDAFDLGGAGGGGPAPAQSHYDAGLTHVHHAHEHPDELTLTEYYGAVDTTWVIYGRHKHFDGAIVGQPPAWLYATTDGART